MKRVALFGGSFNPIHNGHLTLADGVLKAGFADEVWLMVSPHNPLKKRDVLMPETQRLRLAQLAVEGHPGIVASDFEFGMPRPSYTWQTLKALRKAFPQNEFLLLIGGDNWQLFHRWAHSEEILQEYAVIVYPRPGFSVDAGELPPNVSLLTNVRLSPLSSTVVRQRIEQGKDISDMVPPAVVRELTVIIKEEL